MNGSVFALVATQGRERRDAARRLLPRRPTTSRTARRCCTRCSPTATGSSVRIHFLHGGDVSAPAARRLEPDGRRQRGRDRLPADPRRAGSRRCRSRGSPGARPGTGSSSPSCCDLDRILFLDADTIAVDSLAPLWRTDVTDHYLAAVTNVWQWNDVGRERAPRPRARLLLQRRRAADEPAADARRRLHRRAARLRHRARVRALVSRPGRAQRGPRRAPSAPAPALELHEQRAALPLERRGVRRRGRGGGAAPTRRSATSRARAPTSRGTCSASAGCASPTTSTAARRRGRVCGPRA